MPASDSGSTYSFRATYGKANRKEIERVVPLTDDELEHILIEIGITKQS